MWLGPDCDLSPVGPSRFWQKTRIAHNLPKLHLDQSRLWSLASGTDPMKRNVPLTSEKQFNTSFGTNGNAVATTFSLQLQLTGLSWATGVAQSHLYFTCHLCRRRHMQCTNNMPNIKRSYSITRKKCVSFLQKLTYFWPVTKTPSERHIWSVRTVLLTILCF